MKTFLTIAMLLLVPLVAFCQASQPTTPELVLDNDSVRVSSISVADTAVTLPASKYDRVLVTLGPVEIAGPKTPSFSLGTGEARFIAAGEKITVTADAEGSVLKIVELKHHWDAPIRYCSAPANCVRENRVAGSDGSTEQPLEVSRTTNLFTNGFITVARHRVGVHGSLESSYYSAKGKDSILVIAMSDMKVNFGGTDEKLKSGQVYFTTLSPVDVDGSDTGAQWVVVRLNEPKAAN